MCGGVVRGRGVKERGDLVEREKRKREKKKKVSSICRLP
jgi:hypothetical protein